MSWWSVIILEKVETRRGQFDMGQTASQSGHAASQVWGAVYCMSSFCPVLGSSNMTIKYVFLIYFLCVQQNLKLLPLHLFTGSPSTVEQLNRRMKCIRPPHCITRLPRSLDERCHWKASEWRSWLLYYGAPCMEGLLPQRYWRHWCVLAEAIWILLTMKISEQSISHAGI